MARVLLHLRDNVDSSEGFSERKRTRCPRTSFCLFSPPFFLLYLEKKKRADSTQMNRGSDKAALYSCLGLFSGN